jgi:multiple sugar transport system substrate-binding protein
MPTLDSSTYGVGNTQGTIVYIPAGSKHQQEAFFAVQQLTTDPQFLTTLADTVFNIPSTFESLASWDKAGDEHWKPLVDVFKNPGSYYKQLTAAGREDVDMWGTFLDDYEHGKVPSLQAGLAQVASKIDNLNEQSAG